MAGFPFSVLDLSPIVEGGTASDALRHTRDLARHAEEWGYHRYWLAEHHNMPGIASAATSVVIGHVAAGTSTIRVGSGGIMLPNHSPLVIAEQFGTLESLFPGRIDLGVGRAPGTDGATAAALRRTAEVDPDDFPRQLLELMAYFRAPQPGQRVHAVPGAGLTVPIWILGSSLFGAQLAAELGLPYAFASHFAPAQMTEALEVYREEFRPSVALARPYVMLGVNVFAADTHREARRLFTSVQQAFVNLRQGRPGPLPPPVEDYERGLTSAERALLDHALACSFFGTEETVLEGLSAFVARTRADELIVVSQIFDPAARLRSYEIAARVRKRLTPVPLERSTT
jgi:luciferase family oxidoreductase group 1